MLLIVKHQTCLPCVDVHKNISMLYVFHLNNVCLKEWKSMICKILQISEECGILMLSFHGSDFHNWIAAYLLRSTMHDYLLYIKISCRVFFILKFVYVEKVLLYLKKRFTYSETAVLLFIDFEVLEITVKYC